MNICNIMRVEPVQGDVGIEIEVEGASLPQHMGRYWRVEYDGSLRGESCEYVLAKPLPIHETKEALQYLREQYIAAGTRVKKSPRCGVHVHINCQEMGIVELYNFMCLYLIFEELLVKWCGPDREGNLFCLRAQDAEYLTYSLVRAAKEKEFRRTFGTDDLRYASMNVKALATYGSLEFRAMRGTRDMRTIHKWVGILYNLKEMAKEFGNPQEIVMAMSQDGADMLLHQVFKREHRGVITSNGGWEESVMNGVRRIQDIAFLVDWEELAGLGKRKIGGLEVPKDWDEDFPMIDL